MRLLISFLVVMSGIRAYSQDLIVRTSGDSLKCHITQVTDSLVSFEMQRNDVIISTSLPRKNIASFKIAYFVKERKKKKMQDSVLLYKSASTDIIETPVRNISLELLGNGIIYSWKFENRLCKQNFRYALGVEYLNGYNKRWVVLSTEFIYLIGNQKHKLEVGVGLNSIPYYLISQNVKYLSQGIYSNARLGYRYEGKKNIFKVALVPLYSIGEMFIFPSVSFHSTNTDKFLPFFGISYGRKF